MSGRRHVVPHPKGWAVKKPGSSRASSIHSTQLDAINRSRDILRNEGGGENVIHRPDGRIRDADTISPAVDPFPPRG